MAIKYTYADKELFAQVLGKYPIVEDKRTDTFRIEKKRKAWEDITSEFNKSSTKPRTTTQLKRLWDKTKRSRKAELAEERRDEITATNGGPPRTPSLPQPMIDPLPQPIIDPLPQPMIDPLPQPMIGPLPEPMIDGFNSQISYEVDVKDESDEIDIEEMRDLQDQIKLEEPSTSSNNEDFHCRSQMKITPTNRRGIKRSAKMAATRNAPKKDYVAELAEARLLLIEKEEQQMSELHQIRMEEAHFRKEAARFQMLQEELKFNKLQQNE
ncbi:uncharacterized protein LOC109545720 [Dendroctonus ponderosae]|uniref:uncharacterized protein LOC109545720 n=1 Tax=Dendroctonus ponderosae TaxID=77166 RepID=UPI0020351574|nr:uncharacterized protein LOC109545720 [Dendroctonus ponderosae]KAH1024097.1 hypothetical protein HUJ05_003651 [Dendroctonus ponderosae]KAH1024098.1 hypothetical protein HUJ05_003651 [Dendroctonus ponderosae]KAH1024100.1 hypothetical protein HUJ05_003651 [Dendroctonus ponderosae]